MVLFVLWVADGWWGVVDLGRINWCCDMDDDCVQTNQSGGVLSGVAVYNMVGVCAVSEWNNIVFELK